MSITRLSHPLPRSQLCTCCCCKRLCFSPHPLCCTYSQRSLVWSAQHHLATAGGICQGRLGCPLLLNTSQQNCSGSYRKSLPVCAGRFWSHLGGLSNIWKPWRGLQFLQHWLRASHRCQYPQISIPAAGRAWNPSPMDPESQGHVPDGPELSCKCPPVRQTDTASLPKLHVDTTHAQSWLHT